MFIAAYYLLLEVIYSEHVTKSLPSENHSLSVHCSIVTDLRFVNDCITDFIFSKNICVLVSQVW